MFHVQARRRGYTMNIKYPILLKYYRILTQLLAHNETLKAALQTKQAIIDERDFEVNRLKSALFETHTQCIECDKYQPDGIVDHCDICGNSVCELCRRSYDLDPRVVRCSKHGEVMG